MGIIEKICLSMGCTVDDIVEFIPDIDKDKSGK